MTIEELIVAVQDAVTARVAAETALSTWLGQEDGLRAAVLLAVADQSALELELLEAVRAGAS